MKHFSLYCLALLPAFVSCLEAQQVEFSPFYGCRFGGEVQDPDTGKKFGFRAGPAYGLFIDIGQADSEAKFQLLWSRQDSSVDLSGLLGVGRVDLTIDQIQIGGSTEMGGGRFREYVSALVGATHYSTEDYGSDTEFSFSIGVGAKYFPFRNVALRADLRGFCTVVKSSGSFIYSNGTTLLTFSGTSLWQGQATIGVSIAF